MKKIVVSHWMNSIKKKKMYNEIELAEIEYGLTGIYLTLSKLIIIIIISSLLGILPYTILLLIFFNLIRITAFGLHAKKSIYCLLESIAFFVIIPIIIKNLEINFIIRIIVGTINIILIFIFSPADTFKRPLINKKRRCIYKYISTTTSIIYLIISLIIKDTYIQNCCIFSLIIENILILPITYKLTNEPYSNYKKFIVN